MTSTTTTAAAAVAAAATSVTDIVPKSVITIGILVVGFILGFVIAKLANYCYHRADVPDNASDISEHTKGLLRIQLAMLKFGKRGQPPEDPEEAKREQQAMVLNMWKMKAMNKAQQVEADKEAEESVSNVNEKSQGKSDGKKKTASGNAKQENGKAAAPGGSAAKGKAGSAAAAANGSATKSAPAANGSAKGTAAAGGQSRPTTAAKPKKLFPNSTTAISVGTKSTSPTKGKAQGKEQGDKAQGNGQVQQKQSRPTTASTARRESRTGTPRSQGAAKV